MPAINHCTPARFYEIRIAGHLNPGRSALFSDLQVMPLPDGDTLIVGTILDQAALFGTLIRIRDLGLTLISISSTLPPAGSDTLKENN